MQEQVLLKAEEVGAMLRLSKTKTYLALKSGLIPGVVRIGANVRVDKRTLNDWLAEQVRVSQSASLSERKEE